MAAYQKPTFTPGFRLQDGTDLNNLGNALGISTVVVPIPSLAGLADSQTRKINVPFPFKVTAANFRVGDPVTTAAKAATLSTQISGSAVTGGVMALTSAAATPAGEAIAGTAITAANTGAAGDTLEVAASSVTAFAEGGGWVEFTVEHL